MKKRKIKSIIWQTAGTFATAVNCFPIIYKRYANGAGCFFILNGWGCFIKRGHGCNGGHVFRISSGHGIQERQTISSGRGLFLHPERLGLFLHPQQLSSSAPRSERARMQRRARHPGTANYQQRPRRGLGLSGTATDATARHGWGWDPQRAPSRHGLGHKAGGHGHGSILQRSSVAVLADGSMPQWVFVAR